MQRQPDVSPVSPTDRGEPPRSRPKSRQLPVAALECPARCGDAGGIVRRRARSAGLSTTALLLPLGAVRALLVETLVVFPAKDCPQRLQVTASARDNLWQLAQRFVCIQVSQMSRWYVLRIFNDTCWYSKTYCTISCETREPSKAKHS